jgi:hypothetical protein
MDARMELEEALERVRCDYLNMSMAASSRLFDPVIEQIRRAAVRIMVDYEIVSEYPEETYRRIVDQVIVEQVKQGGEVAKEINRILVCLLDLLLKLSKMGDRIGLYK